MYTSIASIKLHGNKIVLIIYNKDILKDVWLNSRNHFDDVTL